MPSCLNDFFFEVSLVKRSGSYEIWQDAKFLKAGIGAIFFSFSFSNTNLEIRYKKSVMLIPYGWGFLSCL